MNKTVTAIVPMRHSSERVPGKNYRNFAGKPLFHYIISSLSNCDSINQIVIDTDSEIIIENLLKIFPEVKIIKRPENLRDGDTPMNDVLLNSTKQIESDFYLQTHSTNPLLKSETLNSAVQKFLEVYPIYDSLFSVTRLNTRLWDQLGRAINHNPNILLRTQDLPPVFEENSCIYIFNKEILMNKHSRIGDRPYLFEIEPLEAIDIDIEQDFQFAEAVYKNTKKY